MPEPLSRSTFYADQQHTSSPPVHNQYLDQLGNGVLTSPVPDYASTLLTQAEQDIEDANLRFLRGELSLSHDEPSEGDGYSWSMSRSNPPSRTAYQELTDLEERAQQVIQQEYSGWAPSTSEGEDDDQLSISRHSSNHQPGYLGDDDAPMEIIRNRMRWRRLRDHLTSQRGGDSSSPPDPSDTPQRHPSRFVENGMSSGATESSLRTQAMLQAVRQNTNMSSRSRHQLQQFILDRERANFEHDGSERRADDSVTRNISPSQRRQLNSEQALRHQATIRAQINQRNDHARQWRDNNDLDARRALQTPHPSNGSMSVETTVRYLESLRLCESERESRDFADERGLDAVELCPHNVEDFLLDTASIPPPPKTSWLQVGSVLVGTQHAMPTRPVVHNPSSYSSQRSQIRHPTLGLSSARTSSPVRSPSNAFNATETPVPSEPAHLAPDLDDKWPVKVTIHAVDYQEMTLSGTMEACDVPDKAAPMKTSNITTYLEGEIIDFNKNTLETKNFKATPRVDSVYWRKLPPFRHLKDEETAARSLLSKQWISEFLMQKWVLMRWKEKHFVTPSAAESSLTISGFYYVALRRSDGRIEGLYYDPSSTPYQHLSLKPEKCTFPAFEFR